MVASKRNTAIQKYTIIKSKSRKKNKQTICIIGYFHDILMSLAYVQSHIHLCMPRRQQHRNRKINAKIHKTANIGSI